jgi:hypothetical protein
VSEESYWSNVLNRRASRRRALAASGALSVNAAILAACGSDGGGGKGPKDSSGLVFASEDTSKQAKRGGVWKWYQTADIVGRPILHLGCFNHYCR